MSGNSKLLIVFSALIISAVSYFFIVKSDEHSSSGDTFISSEWDKKSGVTDLAPNSYGLYTDLLMKKMGDEKIETLRNVRSLDKINSTGNALLVIGDKVGFLQEEWELIKSKVEQGAVLILCSNRLSKNVAKDLFADNPVTFFYKDSIKAGFFKNHKDLSTAYKIYQNDTLANKWYVMKTDHLAEPVTFLNDKGFANSTFFQFGKGKVVFSLNPDLFKNYQLNRPGWHLFMKSFVQSMPGFKKVYWLSFANLSDTENIIEEQGPGDEIDDSLLKLLFSNRVLTLALMLVAIGSVLFIVFRLRRRRPIVPLQAVERHHSSEFARTITSIFINRRNPFGILQLQKKNFYGNVLRYYYVDLSRSDVVRERSILLLSEKSGASVQDLRKIIQLLETRVKINVNDTYLFDVYNRIQAFYAISGIQQYTERKGAGNPTVINRSMARGSLVLGSGICFFVGGLFLLTMAQSYGVWLFIVGFGLLWWGIRMFTVPIVTWDQTRLFVNRNALGKTEFYWSELQSVDCDENEVRFNFSGNGKVQLRWSEISSFDRGHLQRLIDMKLKIN